MMGSQQENWFFNQLISSQKRKATWRVIGSQTGMWLPGADAVESPRTKEM